MLLLPEGPALPTEYGKRWLDQRLSGLDNFSGVLRDVATLARAERWRWPEAQRALKLSGVPTALTNGISQYGMSHLIDHLNGKTIFALPPTVALALATSAPTSTTTGASVAEATYTGYVRMAISQSDVQTVTITGTPTGGTFTLTFGGQTTAAINFNATASEVSGKLQVLSSIGQANVSVSGGPGPGTPWVVNFVGLAGLQTLMTHTDSFTGGSSPVATVTHTINGTTTLVAAATAATPSVALNSGPITFPACTAGSSTLLGFLVADSPTTGAGNALWYGTLASTTVSTTQTPATVAASALSLSITGT